VEPLGDNSHYPASTVSLNLPSKPIFLTQSHEKACLSGLSEALESGLLGGFPVVGVRVLINHIAMESGKEFSEGALKAAAAWALRSALSSASLVLLEPMFKVEVVVPESFVGAVVSDLNARRGRVEGLDVDEVRGSIVRAFVPLSSLFGYATEIRSLTQGRASFSMEFSHYAELSKKISDEILKALGRL
jgi:elongation factor G